LNEFKVFDDEENVENKESKQVSSRKPSLAKVDEEMAEEDLDELSSIKPNPVVVSIAASDKKSQNLEKEQLG